MSRRARRHPTFFRTRLRLEVLEDRLTPSVVLGQQAGAPDTTQFHADAARSGFYQNETVLTPANVASNFGQVWQSPVLDGHLYASPLYEDNILIQGAGNAANHAGDGVQSASYQGKTLGVVFAATGGGTVYAIAAQDTNGPSGIAPGTILWKTHLGNPYGGIDGNNIGVLGTPILDVKSGRIYVTASVTDYLLPAGNPNHGANNWEVFALNLNDGSLVNGWPIAFTQTLLDSLDQNTLNGPNAVPFSSSGADQRGALALSPDGSILYVDYACYGSSNPGWMTTVATGVSNGATNGQTPAVVSAYSGVDSTATNANGGMWGAGGPAVDAAGNVFVSTGDSPSGTGQTPGAWGNSVLEWGPGQTLVLIGVYSPWNYQTQDTIDSDLGGGSPVLIQLPNGSSTTTELLAVGGKQGNGYLVDAGNHLNNPTANPNNSPASYPASLTSRPPVVNPNQDPSLYDPNALRPYFSPAQAGPLALFQPYNETSASGNTAKARDTPATFTGPDGAQYVVWAGSSKSAVGSGTPVAPSLYLTKVVDSPGQPAYLSIVAQNTQVMSLSGANIITANGTANPIDWVVDAGVQRTDGFTSFVNGAPTLYAYNALTMQPLWSSSYEQLDLGGKYNTIAAARGDLFVGTDRIQAFGLTNETSVDDAVQGTGMNQFHYVGAGWTHTPAGTSTSTMETFDGTVSTDNVAGDFVTMTFTGARIGVYANEASGYGSATISVDGGNAQIVSLANTTNSPNGQGEGDVLVYTLSGLGAGTHTLKVQNAGGSTIALDRVVITPLASTSSALGVSLTEGNATALPGHVLLYTINYNNAGSIVDGAGTNAASVVMTETVPANTVADLANSTSGWTLASGTGSAGSTYTFAVGTLNAGATGSVVFTVDVNSTIPNGTTNLSDTVTITDAAGDSSSGTRVTPIGTPVATALVFTHQPSNGETGVALTPAVKMAVWDQFGNTFTSDSSSTVTLTLNGGTFAGGGNTASAIVSSGVAVFSNLRIGAAGSYTLTAADASLTGATSGAFMIQTPTKLAFTQQPSNGVAGAAIAPPVTVTVEDASGATVGGDTSTVTLTLSSSSFASGGDTITANAVNGVATFANIVINTVGNFTVAAADGSLAVATSNAFAISAGTSVYLDFDTSAASFGSAFAVYNNGGANNTSLAWGAVLGVQDQPGPAAGGGVQTSGGVAIDSTAIYTPSNVNLADGLVHTISQYVSAVSGLGSGDKPLQLGYLAAASTGFNAGFSFISARILGNNTVEFQYDNGTSPATSTNNTPLTGTVASGDWLDLILTTQETALGSFKGTFSLVDYGPTGIGPGVTVLAPVSYAVSGLTTLGTASAVAAGFRTATGSAFSGHVRYDNFAVDPPPPARLEFLQQPNNATAGVPLGSFVVAVEDIAGHTVSTDSTTVTLTLSHSTFAIGAGSVTAPAVNGVATFNNLVLNAAGSYILRATDTAPNLDPDYGPFTINPAAASHFALSAPALASVGMPFNFTVTALDPYNNQATSYAGSVRFSSNDTIASLPGNSALPDGAGVFSATLKTLGLGTLTATDAVSAALTGSSAPISVIAATHYTISAPSSVTSGVPFNFTVTALDQSNSVATSYTGVVHFTSSDHNAILPPDAHLTNGVGVFSGTLFTIGSESIQSNDAALTTLDGTSGPITVIRAAATKFAISAPSSITAGNAFVFTVTAENPLNDIATGYSGTVSFSGSDSLAVLPASATLSNGTGDFAAILKTPGNQSITATDTVATSISGVSNVIAVAAVHLSLSASSAAPNAGALFNLTIKALDAFNNTNTQYSGRVHFTSTDSSASAALPADYTFMAGDHGNHVFGNVSLVTAGIQTITATDITSPSINGSASVTVSPRGVIFGFGVVAASAATTGASTILTVTAQDHYGNRLAAYSGAVTLTSSDANAIFVPAGGALAGGSSTFSVTFNTSGAQTVTAADSATTTVSGTSSPIAVSGLTVTSFTSTTTGFIVTFSKPFKPNVINLYDSSAFNFGQADVTLTGLIGTSTIPTAVYGSMQFSSSTGSTSTVDTLTFIKAVNVTSPVSNASTKATTATAVTPANTNVGAELLAGTYTATLLSGANGIGTAFQDLTGAALDGNGDGINGDAYTNTFTVGSQAHDVIVSIPSFARGPGSATIAAASQLINLNNTASTNGIPITLGMAPGSGSVGGITSVNFVLSYDPTMLTISGADTAAGTGIVPAVDSPSFIMTGNDSVHGQATFSFSATQTSAWMLNSNATAGNSIRIGRLNATVPSTALYGGKDLLHFASLTVESGSTTNGSIAADGLHVVAYLGDTSGEGDLQNSNDASLLSRVVASNDTGFGAYRNVSSFLIGDLNADGLLTSGGDTSNLANFLSGGTAVGLVPRAPGVNPPTHADPTLSIPNNLQVNSDGSVVVSVSIDNPHPQGSTGLTDASLALTFDPGRLTVSASDVHLGSLLNSSLDWKMFLHLDAVNGQLAIEVAGTSPILTSSAGSLATITFHQVHDLAPGALEVSLASSITLPGGVVFRTHVADSQGLLTLSLSPASGEEQTHEKTRIPAMSCAPTSPEVNSSSSPAVFDPLVAVSSSAVSVLDLLHPDGMGPILTEPEENTMAAVKTVPESVWLLLESGWRYALIPLPSSWFNSGRSWDAPAAMQMPVDVLAADEYFALIGDETHSDAN